CPGILHGVHGREYALYCFQNRYENLCSCTYCSGFSDRACCAAAGENVVCRDSIRLVSADPAKWKRRPAVCGKGLGAAHSDPGRPGLAVLFLAVFCAGPDGGCALRDIADGVAICDASSCGNRDADDFELYDI